MRTITKLLLASLILVTFSALAADGASGTATGVLRVNGNAADLKFAYLSHERQDARIGTVVTMTDVALTADQLKDRNAFNDLVKDGSLHAVVIKIGQDRSVYSAEIFHNKLDGTYTTALSGVNEFTPTAFSIKGAAGHAFLKEPYKGASDEIFYDVNFSASN